MTEIDGALPAIDGISCFNKLYLAVTQNVLAGVGQATFADPRFLAALDVSFANLYFAALRAFDSGADTPRAWQPLFQSRANRAIAPIQFALAGMNAHINRDLPVALIDTFAALGLSPREDGAQHADFERVNGLLATTEKQVKELYLDGLTRTLDMEFGDVDDVVAIGAWRRRARRPGRTRRCSGTFASSRPSSGLTCGRWIAPSGSRRAGCSSRRARRSHSRRSPPRRFAAPPSRGADLERQLAQVVPAQLTMGHAGLFQLVEVAELDVEGARANQLVQPLERLQAG